MPFEPRARIEVAVQVDPFEVCAMTCRLGMLGGGAVSTFVGHVRADGEDFEALELQAYPAMAERALLEIAQSAADRWDLLGVTLIHRYGRLSAAEPIVFAGAASLHRAASLEACAFLIDWTKTAAPFWKRTWKTDGSHDWVEAREQDEVAAQAWNDASTRPGAVAQA